MVLKVEVRTVEVMSLVPHLQFKALVDPRLRTALLTLQVATAVPEVPQAVAHLVSQRLQKEEVPLLAKRLRPLLTGRAETAETREAMTTTGMKARML